MLALLVNVVFFVLVLRVIKSSKSATATESELLLVGNNNFVLDNCSINDNFYHSKLGKNL